MSPYISKIASSQNTGLNQRLIFLLLLFFFEAKILVKLKIFSIYYLIGPPGGSWKNPIK